MRDRDDDNSGRFDAHRNNADDPVLVPALRRPPDPTSPIALGATQTISRSALAVGEYAIGGQVITLTNPGAGVAPSQTILNWTSPDGVARKGTIILACLAPALVTPFISPRIWPAYYCLVTVGNARGSHTFWAIAPAIIPVEATYVRVDAQLAPAGGQISTANGETTFGAPPAFTFAQKFSGQIKASFFDNHVDNQWRDIQLGASGQQASNVNLGIRFGGPAIVTSIVLNNNNATAGVWMEVVDTQNTQDSDASLVAQVVWVPAKASVSIGGGLLGSFSNCVCVQGRSSPDGSTGHNPAEDGNDANVFCTVRGIQPTF